MEVSVPSLPQRPSIEHLKKQAKDLLRRYKVRDSDALRRFRNSLPAARDKDDDALIAVELRLHDAQSCIAREYGFSSWDELSTYVQWGHTDDPSHLIHRWLVLVYGHQGERPRPAVAARMLDEKPELVEHHSILACAAGDATLLRRLIATDKGWVNRSATLQCPECGAPLGRPPLMAVTHSSLVRLAEFRDRLRSCARLLLESGADRNQPWTDGEHQLTALYGAAGKNHDAELTRMLLGCGSGQSRPLESSSVPVRHGYTSWVNGVVVSEPTRVHKLLAGQLRRKSSGPHLECPWLSEHPRSTGTLQIMIRFGTHHVHLPR
jgi:hypothetical protein